MLPVLESIAETGRDPAFAGKTVVVTGATSGLGARIARGVAERGGEVVAVGRRADALGALAAEWPDSVTGVTTDVTVAADVERLAHEVAERGAAQLVLVNAAGVFGPIAPLVDGDPAAWIQTLMTNAVGPYLMCRALAPIMTRAGWGRIVNVTSAASLHPPGPLNSAYGTSKVALNQMTRHLAAELAGTGVTANVLHPGDVKTEMWSDIRRQAVAAGPMAEPFVAWTDWVEETGGDAPDKALERIAAHVASPTPETGQFLWIEDPLQSPIPSWETAEDEQPWLT